MSQPFLQLIVIILISNSISSSRFAGLFDEALKSRPQLFEFILEILSNPCFSSIMTWEGTNGQFAIIRPDLVAHLWGERNGRTDMTYPKFSRALRYYYHKNVLTKTRGRKYTYKFNFRELDRQYGYKGPFPATSEAAGAGTPVHTIPATEGFPAFSPIIMPMPHESNRSIGSTFSHSHCFPFFVDF